MGEKVPFPGAQKQVPQMQINLNDLTDFVCTECESKNIDFARQR